MKKTLKVLIAVLITVLLAVSCGTDSLFHTVAIINEDNEVVKTEVVGDGEEYTFPGKVDGIDAIIGWILDGKIYSSGEKITVNSDITITVVTGTPVIITLYDNETVVVVVKKGETELTLPAKPERDGYDFDFWNVDGTEHAAGKKVPYKEGMKITAEWKKLYTITYNANGGSGTIESDTFREDSPVTIKGGTGLTKSDLSFSGWNTKADGTGTTYNADDSYNEKADITLYAVWSKLYNLGDPGPAGGFVFYDAGKIQVSTYPDKDGNNVSYTWRYLEAAPENYGFKQWGSSGSYDTKTDIGEGKNNTMKLMGNVTEECSFPAAKACVEYSKTVDGVVYDDWFLPSGDELEKVYNYLPENEKNEDAYFWSSSEGPNGSALYSKASEGLKPRSRFEGAHVRPVRAFL